MGTQQQMVGPRAPKRSPVTEERPAREVEGLQWPWQFEAENGRTP